MLLSIVRFFETYFAAHKNIRELSDLSDRELADIGIERSDIPRVAVVGAFEG